MSDTCVEVSSDECFMGTFAAGKSCSDVSCDDALPVACCTGASCQLAADDAACTQEGGTASGTSCEPNPCSSDPICGNGIIDAGEDCDGANLGGLTCEDGLVGAHTGGTLACTAVCGLDTSGCTDDREASCGYFCNTVQTNCTSFYERFNTRDECMEICRLGIWDAGALDDTSGNTLGCRITAAEAAATDETRCDAADTWSDDTCGDHCVTYCSTLMSTCGSEAPFASQAACEADCAGRAQGFDILTVLGNSFACRSSHLKVAMLEGSLYECAHTAADGGGWCHAFDIAGNTCDDAGAMQRDFNDLFNRGGHTDNFEATGCPGATAGAGGGQLDAVYQFTPPAGDGTATYLLEPVGFQTENATMVYVTTDCDDMAAGCIAFSDQIQGTPLSVELTGGTTYYFVFDGPGAQGGRAQFDIEPATCGNGLLDHRKEDCECTGGDCYLRETLCEEADRFMWQGGELTCVASDCTYDESACIAN